MEPQPPRAPHTCVVAVVIICTMGAMDVYLVEQSAGARRLGVCALALAGDLFFLLALRYATTWVGGEARLAQRGYAMVLWFLFVFALEIKLYFIYQHYATEGRAPDPLARRTLTLLLSICVPALFAVLGATEVLAQAAASFRKKDELRGRLFWVVLDLLDVLEIQASLWEPRQRGLPLWAEGLTFFYCYGLLLVLPCVSLSELGVQGPHPSPLYPLLSLASVNVATLLIRGGLLLLCHDQRISSIFMGKNVLAIALKCCAVLQRHRSTQATGETGHRRATGGQPLRSTQPPCIGEQLHNQTGATGKAHPTASWHHRCVQTTADPPYREPTADQPHRLPEATAESPHTQRQGTSDLFCRHGQSRAPHLHRHSCAQDQAPWQYRTATQHSPTAPPVADPSACREPRATHQVQVCMEWSVDTPS